MTQANTPFGSGVKQRDLIRMSQEEIDEFISGWHTMQCATMNHDGTIHLVAMWYGFLEGCPALETKAKSQKVQNLRRNPQITCMVEEGDDYNELRGVELVGHAEIVEEPDRIFELGKSVVERTTRTPYTEDMKPMVEAMINKRVAVKIHVDRYVSWDHRKLGL